MRLAPTVFVSGTAETGELLALLRAEGFTTRRPTRVTFTVLDTIDGRLHVNGLRLVAERDEVLVLTMSGVASSPGAIPADAVPIRASELLAGPWRDAVAAVSGERLLLAQAMVVATRTVASLRDEKGELCALVTLDDNLRLPGRRKPMVSTVTVHRVAGKGKIRRRVEAICSDAGLSVHGDVLGEVLDEAGVDLTGVSRSPSDMDSSTLAIDGFRSVLGDLFVAVEAYWRGAAGNSDPEFVHGLRVATRRSRSVLVEGKSVLPRSAQSKASAGLGLLGACTGPARDLDVSLAEWNGYLASLPPESAAALGPVRDLLEARRTRAYEELAVGLASPATKAFVREWERWLRRPVSATSLARCPDSGRPLIEVVAERIEHAHSTLLQNGRLITDESPAEQVHDLRRDAKRLRYLLECFSGVLPRKAAKQFVGRLKLLQDNLGEHQDAEVHAAHMVALLDERAAAQWSDRTKAAVGELIQHLRRRTEDARAEFATRFTDYDSSATQTSLDRILSVEPR